MKYNLNNPVPYLRFIHAMSVFVPLQSRLEWRLEWEAEIINRWQSIQKQNRLNLKSKLDLLAKVAGAPRDVALLENNRPRLLLCTLNILVAIALGFPAVQEFTTGGIHDGKQQLLFLSSAAMVVSILFIVSAVAMLREWTAVRSLIFVTGVLSILALLKCRPYTSRAM